MYFLSLPFKIGGDLRDDGVNLLDDGVDLLSNAGRSSMTTISHFALLLWFEIGIWPPPLPPLPDFLPEIKKSPQTNESRCDLSYVITQLKLSVLSLVQTTVGFGNLVSLSTKKSKLINDLQKSDCYSLNSERKQILKSSK